MKIDPDWRAEINPWTPHDELLRVLALRGAIVWSFAHIEQKMSEVLIRSSYPDDYAGRRPAAPFKMSSRFTYLREVLQLAGPLAPYRGPGLLLLDRIEAIWPMRNMMAHADMDVGSIGPVRFRQIEMGHALNRRWTPFYPGELEALATKVGRLSRLCQKLMDRLEARRLLPTFDEGEAIMMAVREARNAESEA